MARSSEFDRRAARFTRSTPLKAVLFDFDGTLTRPGHLDFDEIRRAIDCPPGRSILTYIESIEGEKERARAWSVLDEYEVAAAGRAEEDPDAAAIVSFCRRKGLRLGIVTRNSRRSIERSFERLTNLAVSDFDVIVTRDDPVETKPDPEGVQYACRRMGVSPGESIMVGDYLYDIEAGIRAGSRTVFYDSDPARDFPRPACDHAIARLSELETVLRLYLPLLAGKIPNELLRAFLAALPLKAADGPAGAAGTALGAGTPGMAGTTGVTGAAPEPAGPGLLVGPGIGEDFAAVGLAGVGSEDALILKSDPITLVASEIGSHLLAINSNDIATSGGTPRWFLATLIMPTQTLPVDVGRAIEEIGRACAEAGVALCGGHTEVSDAVTRPIACGTLLGTVGRGRLLRKQGMRPGDLLLMTKGVALEGGAILATELGERLRSLGASEESLQAAAAGAGLMSVLPEARLAAESGFATALHDVTEGGIATALRELSAAGGRKIRVEIDQIRILPETAELCRLLSIDPLGLIGSGSLLICCRPEGADLLVETLSRARIPAMRIGVVGEVGEGVESYRGREPVELPAFDADELTRVL